MRSGPLRHCYLSCHSISYGPARLCFGPCYRHLLRPVFSANVIRSEKLPVPLLSTLDYGEIAKAVRLFDVLHKMRETTILTVSGMDLTDGEKSFSQTWGCKFINKTASDLNIYYNAADTAQAEAIARRWTEETTQTLEPSMEEIIQSARLHLAIKAMMSDTHANAVTID